MSHAGGQSHCVRTNLGVTLGPDWGRPTSPWRILMILRRGVVAALLALATCSEDHSGETPGPRLESSHSALGTVPATEIATWTLAGPLLSQAPTWRYLQSAAFDESRKVLMMFGGLFHDPNIPNITASPELWEWNRATGLWTNRRPGLTGDKPYRRAGAGMVFDSVRNKLVVFGGRTTAVTNYADIWDWDLSNGFVERTNSDVGPSARSQHGMVFEKSTGNVLLFGGGVARTDGSNNPIAQTGVSVAYGDTWEWNPTTGKWTELQPASAPSARYDAALVWDSKRNVAVLFGGMEKPQDGLNGIPKQDTWEWDPATQGWTNRTIPGTKPSPRYGHAMAYDPGRGTIVLVGGWDIDTGEGLADVWEWDPTSGAWTQRLVGSEPNLPLARMYASLVTDSAQDLLDLVGGLTVSSTNPPDGEIWELNPATDAFTDRTPLPAKGWPSPRSGPALAFCPATGKMYLFGGQDGNRVLQDDLSEWDGTSWSLVASDVRPPGRMDAAMAYDPFRKSLILFGGSTNWPSSAASADSLPAELLDDTWEWNSGTRQWTQLFPKSSPEPRDLHGMVTDSMRAKVLLFGGETYPCVSTSLVPGAALSCIQTFTTSEVWEWNGANTTWTNRTPVTLAQTPAGFMSPLLSFDEGRQKMFLLPAAPSAWSTPGMVSATGGGSTISNLWEWDPVSAGWSSRDTGDVIDLNQSYLAYDSLRRRQVFANWPSNTSNVETWEMDTNGPTLYQRVLSLGPSSRYSAAMAFDSQRGVVVLFGGYLASAPFSLTSETWEYKVTKLVNGEGCTAATASNCASGFCVGGVCCGVASCTGACQSCSVAGHEGICMRAAVGMEVPGSCSDGQACDGSGNCKASNGTVCSSASVCASGFCVDGVCCESKCAGACVSCNQAGRVGQCSPYAAGSDPERECEPGQDPCRSTCDGVGACDYPASGTLCGRCASCDGLGTCTPDYSASCGAVDAGTGRSGGAGGTGASGSGGTGGFGGSVAGSSGGPGGTTIGGRDGAGSFGGTVTLTGGAGSLGGSPTGGAGGFSGSSASNSGGAIAGGTSSFGGTTTIGGAGGALASGGAGGALTGGAGGGDGTGGAGGSPDGGESSIPPDAGSLDGRRGSMGPEAGIAARLHRSGCDCDVGRSGPGTPGLPFALLGVVFSWRRLRRRQLLVGAVGVLLLLAACSENNPSIPGSRLQSSRSALGTVPATESATWTRVDAPAPTPNPRYLQAAAFDETRNLLVVFGGWSGTTAANEYGAATQDLWEWNPATGTWTNRTPAGGKPSARAGASMVYDSLHKNFVIFGGRSTTGYDYEDTWEWDPASGAFKDRTTSGPGARSQHSMVFEKSTGKVLLFGGGFADSGTSIWPETISYSDPTVRPGPGPSADGTGIALAFGDTWEWDPSKGTWTQLKLATGPSARYDSALAWDSQRSRAVLFGGMQKVQAYGDGIPQQDMWEWNPATPGWTLLPATGQTPTARWGHALAYDPGRGTTVLAGGKDFQTYLGLSDVWDWDPTAGAWKQRLTGSEANLPAGRMYASLVTDSAQASLDLLAGVVFYQESSTAPNATPYGTYQALPSADLWQLQPATATFTNRTTVQNAPSRRQGHAMAFCPVTGKTYVFGGANEKYPVLDDLWEWDGSSWSQVASDVRPFARYWAAMAYDPYRKSLILFGGENQQADNSIVDLGDTWEWNSGTRQWSQLFPKSSPDPQGWPGMVTDSGRGKVLLLTVESTSTVWEWDGASANWTNRTPVPDAVTPDANWGPLVTFDGGRQKMFLFGGLTSWQAASNSVFWEWDPISAGWALRDSGDVVDFGAYPFPVVAYDSLRRRQVVSTNATVSTGATTAIKTWELDASGPTWYPRDLSTGPTSLSTAAMAFDSQRGVMVLFGSGPNDGSDLSQTWEYKVTKLGNGDGCAAATASACASGFCVDGVCCSTAACSGICQSCAVAGQQGTCAQAGAGMEVPGSCAGGQACDGSGSCKSKNGTACSSAGACASGFCADGVCCENACNGTCVSCNQAGRAGSCLPYALGSDPEKECGFGDGACRSNCNGAGACDYPQYGAPCGTCSTCDGNGMCFDGDPSQCGTGGAGGGSGSGGTGAGGAGGVVSGGAGGRDGGGGFGGSTIGGAGGAGRTGAGGAGGVVSGGTGGWDGGGGFGGIIIIGGAGGGGGGSTGGAGGVGGGSTGGVGGSGGGIVGGAGGLGSGGGGGRGGGELGGSPVGGTGGSGGGGGTSGSITGGAAGSAGAGGTSGSHDGGPDSIASDAGSPDGRRDSRVSDAGSTVRLGHKGCVCDLGRPAAGMPGLPFALVGAALLWRRLRRRR